MTENDFFVAIQGIMTAALDAGWDSGKVHESTTDAADEWLGEIETEDFDEETAND